LTKNSRSCCGD